MAEFGSAAASQPPAIPGVRRSFISARGVRFHVTEAGPEDGRPVVLLHGWPQHHYAYRDLLANPPAGLRIIVPDLPGYGWSGPAPHRWAKDDVASDLFALLDEMGIERAVLGGHDWGAFIGYRMILREPERFSGYLAMNMAHPWVPKSVVIRNLWRFLTYQPLIAIAGKPVQQRTGFLEWAINKSISDHSAVSREVVRSFSERFRDPVCAQTATDTYRTFWLKEIPQSARNPERRRGTIPIRVLFGMDDVAVHYSMADPATAKADDYTFEAVSGCGHFIVDERPDLVRARLIELADSTE
ncbi:alpha/beta fold hydrolase [Nocardia sp. SYP-A9097]|uniref:alpha/beta fold hydrolase n=1 Tax=Nocardia sp. SYP-A9097 TaxID=2663237 RepID=UPI00129B0781|nr:alpha/beta hydrolase [Nocardia sp. SYP-A9097]MRH90778.1 alpha/beta fold hydrolase [Nocardia sp. SYP-A9097]